MSSKACSPGGALLRNSRLMSLPPPLPPPATASIYRRSNPPYPTHQAIATHDSSRARGDWGLKYNLPLKVSQRYLKYRDLDTLEHKTTFETAEGEVQFVQKMREIGMPVTQATHAFTTVRGNAFEEIEWIGDDGKPTGSSESTKWRFASPYLPSLTPAQLKRYILKKVKSNKEDFYTFVQKHLNQEHEHFEAPGMRELAEDEELKPVEEKDIPVDLNKLRGDPIKLQKLIISFLDLPVRKAPPQTHPSAGLLYTRSAQLANDPFTGPDMNPYKPIPGRPFGFFRGSELAGIAGVVARVVDMGTTFNRSFVESRELIRYYSAEWIAINSDGSVDFSSRARLHQPSEEKPDVEAIRARQFRKKLEKAQSTKAGQDSSGMKQGNLRESGSDRTISPQIKRVATAGASGAYPVQSNVPVVREQPSVFRPPVQSSEEKIKKQAQIHRDAFANSVESVLSMLEDTEAHKGAMQGRPGQIRKPGRGLGIPGGKGFPPRT